VLVSTDIPVRFPLTESVFTTRHQSLYGRVRKMTASFWSMVRARVTATTLPPLARLIVSLIAQSAQLPATIEGATSAERCRGLLAERPRVRGFAGPLEVRTALIARAALGDPETWNA
jgi:hypothetical protein